MQYHSLGKTGMKVSRLSFGASALSGVFRSVEETEAIKAVHAALECGINYFDVAPAYGGTVSETVLGKALRGVPRNRYYLSTKVGKYTPPGAMVRTLWIIHGRASGDLWTRAPRGWAAIILISSISTISNTRDASTRNGH